MSQLAIRFLVLSVCATAMAAIPLLTSGEAEAGTRHANAKKHARHWRHASRPWFGEQRPFVAPSQSDSVCPGIGRSFECKIWPPPFEDDPDRKTSKY
jgi:hypothetical protein